MSRQIECSNCHKDMGEIANGSKLRRGIVYLCSGCNDFQQDCIRRFSAQIDSSYGKGDKDVFGDIFGDIFGTKK